MPDNQYTALLLIIDRSGSMHSIREDMVGGLMNLLDEQRQLPGLVTVDLVIFDEVVETTHALANIENVIIELEPRGRTALHDAIGIGVTGFSQRIEQLPEHARPHTVQVVVVTDGLENSSSEYSDEQVKNIVETKQADSHWDFMFLGANQDAVLAGGSLGFRQDASMTFAASSAPVISASQAASRYISERRSGGRRGFTEKERREADEN